MSYSPVASALLALSACQDSAILQIAKTTCREKKSIFERQEAIIMSCFLQLLAELPEEDQKEILKVVKAEP
ncbi:hypothetical protein SG34_004105 [Thalassomonas viridans]|uniref:Uncharacterized protein n=1 Tax=Thalassomonas viridans TaxID=137584 RepID=A0AAE9Z6R2_9GAMM|nr:hypothetical protein [Thalassomonas viridans]WDE06122.1 hypothetical protein SG34_004105 [Thalassomonas viridans]